MTWITKTIERKMYLFDREGKCVGEVKYLDTSENLPPDVLWVNNKLYHHWKSGEMENGWEHYKESEVVIVSNANIQKQFAKAVTNFAGKRIGYKHFRIENIDIPSIAIGRYYASEEALVFQIGSPERVRRNCGEENTFYLTDSAGDDALEITAPVLIEE